jgi:hypothetical protein
MIGELSGIIIRRHNRRPGDYQRDRGIITPGDMSQEDSFQERQNPGDLRRERYERSITSRDNSHGKSHVEME